MKQFSSFVFFILLGLELYGQTAETVRPEIQEIVKGIAEDNVLKGGAVGIAGIRTEQWERYEKLKKDATNAELVVLTDNDNAVVRCYAFEALTTRQEIDIFPVLLKHLSDTSTIQTFFGCVVSSKTVGDYFVNVVTPRYYDADASKLTTKQSAYVDSVLLFDKSIRISAKYSLLSDSKPNPAHYSRIREIAISERDPVAVLALARFRNKNDLEIIRSLFRNENTEYYAAYSAREFPDSLFYPYLVKIFQKEWKERYYDYPKWRILYQALAKYPNPQSYKLFERTTKAKNEFRYQTLGKYLKLAITKYPDPLFEPLKEKIKLKQFYLDALESEMEVEN